VIGCVLIWAVATAWSVQRMSRLSAASFRAPAPPSSLAVTVSTKGSALVDSEALERFAQLYAKWSEFTAKLGCETADLGKVEASECALAASRDREEELHAVADSRCCRACAPTAATGASAQLLRAAWRCCVGRYEALYRQSRKAAGEASCRLKGTGPTGGFCLSNRTHVPTQSKNNWCLSPLFAHTLGRMYGKARVLDLGCGMGQYGRYFEKEFKNSSKSSVTWLGLDGAEEVEATTGGFVRFADLADGLPSDVRQQAWDWVMSIEVAEHIPQEFEYRFVHNILVARPRVGIVLTWARHGQNGYKHVNCQSSKYVSCVLRQLGWEQDLVAISALQDSVGTGFKNCSWLKKTVLVFRPAGAALVRASSNPQLVPLPSEATPAFAAAYNAEMTRKCPRYTEVLGCKGQTRMVASPRAQTQPHDRKKSES